MDEWDGGQPTDTTGSGDQWEWRAISEREGDDDRSDHGAVDALAQVTLLASRYAATAAAQLGSAMDRMGRVSGRAMRLCTACRRPGLQRDAATRRAG